MANTDRVNGGRPAYHLTTGKWNGAVRKYFTSEDLAPGDVVKLSGTGSTAAEVEDNADGIAGVAQLAAEDGNAVGVVVTVEPNPSALDRIWHDQSVDGDGYVWVADDPLILFEFQEDSVTENMEADDIGQLVDFVDAEPNSTTGASGFELDSETGGSGADARVIELVQAPDNALGANARWLVLLAHIYLQSTTGV